MKTNKMIEKAVSRIQSKYELQKASVGAAVPLTEALRTEMSQLVEAAKEEERERVKKAVKASQLSGLNKARVYTILTPPNNN